MSNLIEHTIKSIENAEKHISDINQSILDLEGMSSPKVRHLLNNITKLNECNYLEIGCWKGSTSISALFNNKVKNYWLIDNFSEFGGPKNEFINNFTSIMKYSPNLIDRDFISFDPIKEYNIKDVNLYFYDGFHSSECQRYALSHYINSLQNEFIYLCDDWNYENIRHSTKDIIKELNLNILYEIELPAKFNGDTELWWNGLLVSVLQKTKK